MGLKENLKTLAALSKKMHKLEKENAALALTHLKEIKGKKIIDLFGNDALKCYADAVKKSNSLTAMRPSVVKAIESVAHTPTSSAIKNAIQEVEKHTKDVETEYSAQAKTDKKMGKQLKDFTAALKSISMTLKKQQAV